ncbi:hypothetical protein [Leifsonia sp. NPDC058248]|uniref:hypothetical protein n=1 Tax=Leifsonia sp. NPDC058248 TaxID=3346402 RepID=UPI0036DF524B
MDASNWINLALLVVAVVAALFAAFQVVEARKARADAQEARDQAESHERAALAAATRSADSAEDSAGSHRRIAAATEDQVRLVKALAPDRKPWTLSRIRRDGDGWVWTATNNTLENATDVSIGSPRFLHQRRLVLPPLPVRSLPHGKSIEFRYLDEPYNPGGFIRITWTPADGDEQRSYSQGIR